MGSREVRVILPLLEARYIDPVIRIPRDSSLLPPRLILSGAKGPDRDFVVINAGAALIAAEMAEDLRDGAVLAAESIDSGAAGRALEAYILASHAGA